jgi:hypothetical protein
MMIMMFLSLANCSSVDGERPDGANSGDRGAVGGFASWRRAH